MVGRGFVHTLAGYGRRARGTLREVQDDLKAATIVRAVNRFTKRYIPSHQKDAPSKSSTDASSAPLLDVVLPASIDIDFEEIKAGVLPQARAGHQDDEAVAGAAVSPSAQVLYEDHLPQASLVDQDAVESGEVLSTRTRSMYLRSLEVLPQIHSVETTSNALAAIHGINIQLAHRLHVAGTLLESSAQNEAVQLAIIKQQSEQLHAKDVVIVGLKKQLDDKAVECAATIVEKRICVDDARVAHQELQTQAQANLSRKDEIIKFLQDAAINTGSLRNELERTKAALAEHDQESGVQEKLIDDLRAKLEDNERLLAAKAAADKTVKAVKQNFAAKEIQLALLLRKAYRKLLRLKSLYRRLERANSNLQSENTLLHEKHARALRIHKQQLEKLKAKIEEYKGLSDKHEVPPKSEPTEPRLLEVPPWTPAEACMQEILLTHNLEVQQDQGTLTAGAQGDVQIVVSRVDNKKYIRKQQQLTAHNTWHDTADVPREAFVRNNLLQGFPGLVTCHGYKLYPPRRPGLHHSVELFYEYCDGGDLQHLMEDLAANGLQLHERIVWHLLRNLVNALLYMHGCAFGGEPGQETWYRTGSLPVLHRDIKPGNIFLRKPKQESLLPEVVFGDFGFAEFEEHSFGAMGTLGYDAPEVHPYLVVDPDTSLAREGQRLRLVTPKGDIYALGATIHAVMALAPRADEGVFEEPDDGGMLMYEGGGAITYSAQLWAMVQGMLVADPTMRFDDAQLPSFLDLADQLIAKTEAEATQELASRQHLPWPHNLGLPLSRAR